MKALISITIWLSIIGLTILLFFVVLLVTIISFPFDRKRKLAHRQCYWWSRAVVALNPYWGLKVSGLENIDPDKTYVVVANHQSLADIVVLYGARMQFKWVAKESLFKVPFIGWSLSLTKHIKLKRGKTESIIKVYKEAIQWLRKDMSVLFFPEGTRSQTEQMNKFQSGAFKLAIKEKKLILPISIKGTGEAIPKGSWIFKTKVSAELKVLPAISTENFKPADFARLRDIVWEKMSTNLE
ncbi:MAG: 1-acylglycerol-3-phosphate O-acyltransferase [Candidatus Omnitrophica bacterium]|nr:1-acylglycerol-3-phosphate O-acyltransferase [Candidatus Omnitrophota bacterium]